MDGVYEGEELVEMYEVFRPTYPVEIVTEVLKFLDEQNSGERRRGFVLDVGCGGGQATRMFSPHFEKVLGIDLSTSQINMAKKTVPNVEYKIGSASDLPVESGSVDLVISGAAAHHFDLDAFSLECNRVLRPGGCVAIFTYLPCMLKSPQGKVIEKSTGKFGIMNHLMRYFEAIGLSDKAVNHLEQCYQSIHDQINMTCKKMSRDIKVDKQFTVDKYINLLETVVEYVLNKASFGDKDPLIVARKQLEEILGNTDDNAEKDSSFIATFEYPIVLLQK